MLVKQASSKWQILRKEIFDEKKKIFLKVCHIGSAILEFSKMDTGFVISISLKTIKTC